MNYKERLKAARANRKAGFRFPEDDYNVKLDTFDIGISRKGDEMITLTWKIFQKGSELHGKKIVDRFLLKVDFRFDTLLDLLDTYELDLSSCQSPEDLEEVLEAAKDLPLKTKINVSYTEGEKSFLRIKYYALEEKAEESKEKEEAPAPKQKAVAKPVADVSDEEEEEEAPKAPKKPIKKAKPAPEPEEDEEEEEEKPVKKAPKKPAKVEETEEEEEEEEVKKAPKKPVKGVVPKKTEKPKKVVEEDEDEDFDADMEIDIDI